MNVRTELALASAMRQAHRLLECGDASSAAALAGRVVRRRPSSQQARLLHARALLELNRADEALRVIDGGDLYARLTSAEGRTVRRGLTIRRAVLRAEALIRLCRVADARKELTGVLELDPNHEAALRRLAMVLMEAGQWDEALGYLSQLLDLRRDDASVVRLMAEACEACGCVERALWLYKRWATLRSKHGGTGDVLRLRLARLCRQADRLPEALEHYDALLSQGDGWDASLCIEASEPAMELGDDARVVGYLTAALKRSPGNGQAMRRLAHQHMRSGRFAAAGGVWFRLWRGGGDDGPFAHEALAGLHVCAVCCGRYGFARRVDERLRSSAEGARRLRLIADQWLAAAPGRVLLASVGHSDTVVAEGGLSMLLSEAADTFCSQTLRYPDHADAHYHLGVCRAELGAAEDAADSLERALRINPRYVDAASARVSMMVSQGELDGAASLIDALAARRGEPHVLLEQRVGIDVRRGDIESGMRRLTEASPGRELVRAMVQRIADGLQAVGDEPLRRRWYIACRDRLGLVLERPWRSAA